MFLRYFSVQQTTYRIGNHVYYVLLGMVEARSVNVKKTTTTTSSSYSGVVEYSNTDQTGFARYKELLKFRKWSGHLRLSREL